MVKKGKQNERLKIKGATHKAYKVLLKLIDPKYVSKDKQIPLQILQKAKGIAFITTIRAGMIWTGTLGTGIIVSKLENDEWSGPSSLGTVGMGFGLQIGASSTDAVIILNTTAAVKAFSGKGQVKFGSNLSLAAGPVGRDAAVDVRLGDGGIAACYSYSHSRGAFAGLSLQGSVLVCRDSDNAAFYGHKITATAILNGIVIPPQDDDVEALHRILRIITKSISPAYSYRDSITGSMKNDFENNNDNSSSYFDSFDNDSDNNRSFYESKSASSLHEYDDKNLGPMIKSNNYYEKNSEVEKNLPKDWIQLQDSNGRLYYWNQITNITQWERPNSPLRTNQQILKAIPLAATVPASTEKKNPVVPIRTSSSSFSTSAFSATHHPNLTTPSALPRLEADNCYNSDVTASQALSKELSCRLNVKNNEEGSSSKIKTFIKNDVVQRSPPLINRANRPISVSSIDQPHEKNATAAIPVPSVRKYSNSMRPSLQERPVISNIQPIYTLEQAQDRRIPNADPTRLEEYLTPESFQNAFQMDLITFKQIPKWKRDQQKKTLNLY